MGVAARQAKSTRERLAINILAKWTNGNAEVAEAQSFAEKCKEIGPCVSLRRFSASFLCVSASLRLCVQLL